MPRRSRALPGSMGLSGEIGARIRVLREEREITLTALALETGLGKGTLSELERGRRNPTLDTLFAITTALRVPLSALLPDDERARVRDAGIDARLLDRWTEGGEVIEVYRMTIGEEVRHSRAHAAGVVETITVLRGRVVVGSDHAAAELSAGQSHTFPGDTDHQYRGLVAHSSTILTMRYPGRGGIPGQDPS